MKLEYVESTPYKHISFIDRIINGVGIDKIVLDNFDIKSYVESFINDVILLQFIIEKHNIQQDDEAIFVHVRIEDILYDFIVYKVANDKNVRIDDVIVANKSKLCVKIVNILEELLPEGVRLVVNNKYGNLNNERTAEFSIPVELLNKKEGV